MIDTTLTKINGVEAQIVTLAVGSYKAVLTDLGARLLELHVPDRNGDVADIVLQRSTFEEIATDDNYMGSTAGRYANRIRSGSLTIDDSPVQLSINEGENHLHGGLSGFDRKIWSIEPDETNNAVTFWRISPDGEEGYPGTLTTSVTYQLIDHGLNIDINATTDRPTITNIVHHSYFNLGGHDSGTILDHELEMRSEYYLPVDDNLLPTGEVLTVADTPFDFRKATSIGAHLAQVTHSGAGRASDAGVGYDHNFILTGNGMRDVVTVTDPRSGRRMTMATDQPGVQLYVGGYLEGVTAKAPATTYPAFAGFTLETQRFPDSPNISHFPSAVLRPGETYVNRMAFTFSTV